MRPVSDSLIMEVTTGVPNARFQKPQNDEMAQKDFRNQARALWNKFSFSIEKKEYFHFVSERFYII